MDSYTSLLERTRVPQPSLQRFAVISIFEKLRSAPPQLGPDSDPGREVIIQCLRSKSAPVVDQSVRGLCCLVKNSKFDLSRGLLELQSALEGSDSCFVNLFVKGLGFLVRLGFQNNGSSFRFFPPETHPFIKILSCRKEVQSELLRQILLFMVQNKASGMVKVCDFLRPFVYFSVIRMTLSAYLSAFARTLISTMGSLCCSFPLEAIPVIKLLTSSLKYSPCGTAEDFTNVSYLLEYTVDTYAVMMRHLVPLGLIVQESQLFGVELLETIFSLRRDLYKHSGGGDFIVEMSRRLVVVQKDLGLSYISQLSSVVLYLFVSLTHSELEHQQLSILKLLLLLLEWKNESEEIVGRAAKELNEELLFIFPVINLVLSPSVSVKQAASHLLSVLGKVSVNLLTVPKKELRMQGGFPSISTPEIIVFRLLQHLWFQGLVPSSGFFYVTCTPISESGIKGMHEIPKTWPSLVREYSLKIVERRKSFLSISRLEEIFLTEMPLLLSSVASVLVMHQELWSYSVDLLATAGSMDPKVGVPLLLIILFYNYIFSGKDKEFDSHHILLKLLSILPSLGSHSAMIPLIIQTITPMLHKDANRVLYVTAIRLLCKVWEINDRIFPSLQAILLPKGFIQFASERIVCISMAVSIRDVCRVHPDRGVDLILSVSACVESRDPIIQALGFQSLAHLCEADAIDFYTAWDVIAKHISNCPTDPIVALSLCSLLKWGAMDAGAYTEAAKNVLQFLWEVGTSKSVVDHSRWLQAQASAFEALSHYEVAYIQKSIPNFKEKNMELLTSETNLEVLEAVEEFEVKIMIYEHMTRRRLVKDKRVSGSKIEKLLHDFPKIIFASGNSCRARELPGAALFCLSFHSPNNLGMLKGLDGVCVAYENMLVEISSCQQLSRNILIALVSLQSWKPFIQRWMRAYIMLLDAKTHSTVLDKTSKAGNDLLKSMIKIAKEAIPRSAENISLAVGALCLVLPSSAHSVKAAASKFLLNWLFQYEHEYRQWSAAISLGLISSCLHVTEHKQKFENISGLLEVMSACRSTLVKGACGVGLGFSSQGLLTRFEAHDVSQLDKETYKRQEVGLIGKIVEVLCQMMCQFSPSSSDSLSSISTAFLAGIDEVDSDMTFEVSKKSCNDWEEDIWGVAGLILGLGISVSAIYRSGSYDAVLKIKALIISWIPHVNLSVQNTFMSKKCEMLLSVGSCLALPIVVDFCRRVELVDNAELNHLMIGVRELVSELANVEQSGSLHQSLLMASCVGAGSLVSCSLNDGVYPLEPEHVKDLLALFRKCYSDPHPPLVHLGGMLGVVNALGAGAGYLLQHYALTTHIHSHKKETSSITGPLLSIPVLEPDLFSLIQEMFLVAQNYDDQQLQHYAAWSVSFLRHSLLCREPENEESSFQGEAAGLKSVSQSFPEDSVAMRLSLWLMHLSFHGTGIMPHVNTVATALRCLSRASRVPLLDWGAIIRRCMRYEGEVAPLMSLDSGHTEGILREECIRFSLAHANKVDPLLSFLDELCDLSRFRTLELILQSCLLSHLADLIKIFTGSRLDKLFDDVANFLSGLVVTNNVYDSKQKSFVRVSCWKGLYLCLDETSLHSQVYVSNMEKCMEVLFSLLPSLQFMGVGEGYLIEEWSEAVKCLGKARHGWILDLLQVSNMDFFVKDAHFSEIAKKIQARAKLVQIGSIHLSELGKLKAYILNCKSEDIWDVLVEVAACLQLAEGSVKRQWLVDILEISCVTTYPSTALQFLGLLSGNCSKYMPLLIVDRFTVLRDLPVTLTSLLSETSWEVAVESVALYMWKSMERVYDWVTCLSRGDEPCDQPLIDESEKNVAAFLVQVMHHVCVSLKDHLPLEKQLRLADMVLP